MPNPPVRTFDIPYLETDAPEKRKALIDFKATLWRNNSPLAALQQSYKDLREEFFNQIRILRFCHTYGQPLPRAESYLAEKTEVARSYSNETYLKIRLNFNEQVRRQKGTAKLQKDLNTCKAIQNDFYFTPIQASELQKLCAEIHADTQLTPKTRDNIIAILTSMHKKSLLNAVAPLEQLKASFNAAIQSQKNEDSKSYVFPVKKVNTMSQLRNATYPDKGAQVVPFARSLNLMTKLNHQQAHMQGLKRKKL